MTEVVTYIELDVPLFDGKRFAGFNGTTWLTRGAGLTGAADSKQLLLSFWFHIAADQVTRVQSASGPRILTAATALGGSTNVDVVFMQNDVLNFLFMNSAGTTILDVRSTTLMSSLVDGWHHALASFDLSDTTKRYLYLDDVADTLVVSTYTNDTIDFTRADWAVGAIPNGANIYEGSLGDLWFNPGTHLALGTEANRRKFITAEGKPARVGLTGSNPTGTAPLVFLSGEYTTWHTNKGTGGGFTPTNTFSPQEGALTPAEDFLETFRFAKPSDYLDNSIYAIPSVRDVSFTPSTISLGENLGVRASLKISLGDHFHSFKGEAHDAGTFWGKWRGRYGTKLRGRNIRLIRGVRGQSISAMDTRYYVVETTDGPTPDAVYMIEAKDVLKLADDDRSQAPVLSNGSLSGTINAAVTSATLSPLGIGNLEYPSSGWVCLGGKEVVSFTRVGDALTIVRGQFGSVAQTHESGSRVQLVLRYDGDDVADIIRDLLVNYAGIPDAYIPLTEWQAETAANLNVIYAATLTEPISVKKLVAELIEQAALAVFWDDRARLIRLTVLREISTDADTFDEDRIIEGTLRVKEQPERRISQLWTYYGQRDPTDGGAKEDGFRAALATVDLATESEYGSPLIRKIQARWIETLSAAERLGQIQISRFRDPPRTFEFDLPPDENVTLASGYQVEWKFNQDEDGNVIPALIQITRIKRSWDRIEIMAEEMLASGVITLTHTVILTTTGAVLNWTVPATWNNASNSISVIAGGGGGNAGSSFQGGRGGGGGAFSQVENVTLVPGALIPYRVGDGGAPGANGTDTWFGASTFAASTVAAKAGQAGTGRASGGAGGLASGGIGTLRTSGGNGGNGGTNDDERGGGGGAGGAGGPNGDGANGGSNAEDDNGSGAGGGAADGGSVGQNTSGGSGAETPGNGGNNRFGFGGGTSASVTGAEGGGGAGDGGSGVGAGGTGEQLFTQTEAPIISAGPGGGGGGGRESSPANRGGAGGLYGGGGGGGGANSGGGGPGAQGVIAITWREA